MPISQFFLVAYESEAFFFSGLTLAQNFQELLGLQGIVDKSKVYVDFVAGTLVLVNSLVMLAELELEGQAAGVIVGQASQGPNLQEVQYIFNFIVPRPKKGWQRETVVWMKV